MRFGAPRAVGKHFTSYVAVFRGIGINQQGRGAVFFRSEGFESAIAVRIGITHQNNFPFYVDAIPVQQVVVFWISAVGVNDGSGNFSTGGITEPGAGDFGIFCVGVDVVWSFA